MLKLLRRILSVDCHGMVGKAPKGKTRRARLPPISSVVKTLTSGTSISETWMRCTAT